MSKLAGFLITEIMNYLGCTNKIFSEIEKKQTKIISLLPIEKANKIIEKVYLKVTGEYSHLVFLRSLEKFN